MSRVLSSTLREPLVHFVLAGALLFLAYGWLNPESAEAQRIVIDQARVDALVAQHERTWQRRPTSSELRGLVDGTVREEILYREGVRAGLDRDDPVIRRRVAQKMGFMFEAMSMDVPTDAELQSWLDAHAERYRRPVQYTLEQIYIDPQRHGVRVERVAADWLDAARRGARPSGDASLLPALLEATDADALARTFGTAFVEALVPVPIGAWHGPLPSSYGQHLVRIARKDEARMPPLADVRISVLNDYQRSRSTELADAAFSALRTRYDVAIEADLSASLRAAGRDVESAPARQ